MMSDPKFSHKKNTAKHSGSLKNHQAKKSLGKQRNDLSSWDKKGRKSALVNDARPMGKKYRTTQSNAYPHRFADDDAWEKPQSWKKGKRQTQKPDFPHKKHNAVDDFADKTYPVRQKNHFSGSLMVITHDRQFLDSVTTSIIELDRGSLKTYDGNFSQYRRRKEEELAAEETQNRLFDQFHAQEEA